MKKIYENIDFTQVGLFQTILESEGISTMIKNYDTFATAGLLLAPGCSPELWILDDEMFEHAQQLLENYDRTSPQSGSTWTCFTCNNAVDSNYQTCWHCSVLRPNTKE